MPVAAEVRACRRDEAEAEIDVVRIGTVSQEAPRQGRREPGGDLLVDPSEGLEVEVD
jgi:hypothetical protein